MYGKINFRRAINLQRLKNNPELLNRNIRISDKKILINTKELTEFGDIPADILFRNVDLINPKITYNGAICSQSICQNISYNRAEKTFSLSVSHFSEFEVVEGCGDGTCDGGESCSSCSIDCGSCATNPSSSSSSSGGSGGGSAKVCIPKWNCTEGPCINKIQRQICIDSNKCGTNLGKPDSAKPCFIDDDCIDNDGDGYGVGPDCFGLDLDDNDPGITDKIPGEGETPFAYLSYLKILTVILIIVLILVLIIRMIYLRNVKKSLRNKNTLVNSKNSIK